ncbi:MAG: hypothetical protein WBN40_02345 [Pseudomonadales bacterium]
MHENRRRCRLALKLNFLISTLLLSLLVQAQQSYHLFESGHVRPLALSPDGSKLFAVNTPDNRLEIFDVSVDGLAHSASVPVGLEPVAVAVRNNSEVWVVNHLSDSVSIVDVSATPPRVTATLLVGDEARDIVFGGTGGNRAFISAARRGQHLTDPSLNGVINAGDPELTTPGEGRAHVWIFDANATGVDAALGGIPLGIVEVFSDTPRALAISPDGNTVYVAAFQSGNGTTVIDEPSVCNGFQNSGGSACGPGAPGGIPGPLTNDPASGNSGQAPETGLIVKFDGSDWLDTISRNWSSLVHFNLPDKDVFSFNANVTGPGDVNLVEYAGAGTVLYNMVVNPATGKVYVSNHDSPNHIRFEGAGDFGGSTVQGQLSKSRITVINPLTSDVSAKHLNQHIDYSKLHTAHDPQVDADIQAMREHTLAIPLQITTNSAGTKVYMAAFGSGKIGVFDAADLEDPNFSTSFDPTIKSANYIDTAGGPSGLVLDETQNKIYVMQRFDHSIAEIDAASGFTMATHPLPDPEPVHVKQGRPFLYDGLISSGNGESSCASCHIFGDLDHLAWNLGDPDGAISATNNQPSSTSPFAQFIGPGAHPQPFHPMKGPMTTQTLRGMATHGAMHWRGDRVDGANGADPCNNSGPSNAACDEAFSFNNFIVAFEGLLGKDGTITPTEMQQFTNFILEIRLPPNPIAELNGTFTGPQSNGAAKYLAPQTDGILDCNGCHTLNPAQGFFGADGRESFEAEPQNMKIAHLRNLYQKIGMFSTPVIGGPGTDQIRGFGFLHDGSVGSVKHFLEGGVFNLNPQEVLDMEQFMLAFPTDLAPIVGQQVTLTASNAAAVDQRINLLIARAQTGFDSFVLGPNVNECDLVVKGAVGSEQRGWLLQGNGAFLDDTGASISQTALRALPASEGPLTFTCAVPGTGLRMAIDRDEDSALDGNDNCPATANAAQLNFDADAQGDACDSDDDNDELSDLDEAQLGTNPLNPDSDGDTYSDGFEVMFGTDPLSAASSPDSMQIPLLPWLGTLLLMLGFTGITAKYGRSARTGNGDGYRG